MRSIMISLLVLCGVIGVWAGNTAENIQNKRIGLFYDEQFPWRENISIKPLAWYTNTLTELGLEVRVVNAKELSDEKLITRKKFDTIFLPDGSSYPLKAEYTLTSFLAEGGRLVVGELQEEVKAYDEEQGSWSKAMPVVSNARFYSVFSEWQIRRNWSLREKGKRNLNVPLTRNAQLPETVQSRLPQAAGPFASDEWFQVLGRVNGDSRDVKDMSVSANIFWPVYILPGGEKTDFVGYRHHNIMLNGSTVVVLGKTGRLLLKTDAAAGVLYAAFKICELPFPGEQSETYYQRLFDVQQALSRLGEQYVGIHAALSDAALAAFYQGKADRYAELRNQLGKLDNDFFALLDDKRKTDMLLNAEEAPEQQDTARKEMLARIPQLAKEFKGLTKGARKETDAIRRPAKVAVTNTTCDRLHFDAGWVAPIGWYMLRRHYFQTLKQLGLDVSSTDNDRMSEYLRDPLIRKNSAGVKFMVRIDNWQSTYSSFDPVTGTVKEIEDVKQRRESYDKPLETRVFATNWPALVSKWKNVPIYRYYIYEVIISERGMVTLYWGEQARQDYQAYLAKKYSTIEALNQRWKSNYQSLADIPAPVRQPQTEPEHGNWEDWTVFRDDVYNQKRKAVYDLSKQNSPDIPVSVVMSIEALKGPYFGGNNLYLFTQNQDISAMDGTYLAASSEWSWFDLTCGIPFHTPEWGVFYLPSPDPRKWKNTLTVDWWALFTGGAAGANCYFWSWGGYRANSVDNVGLPTLTGWQVKKLIEEVNQFDHIILDGKRRADIRILYSNTCRRHDQAWRGVKSRHQDTVNNLYYMFMRWQWPTRVLAEEALNEGKDIATCKLLLIPQAEYLKESTQDQVLDYVRGGGNVLVEGYSGKLDNYGHDSAKLFATAYVKCLPSSSKVALIDGEKIPLGSSENLYRMEPEQRSDAKVLVSYADKSPAVVSCQIGKGKLVFSGIPFGMLNMKEGARRIMDGVNKNLGLVPRYEGKDPRLVMREWEYQGQTYLLCYYPNAHDNQFQECALKIHGAYKVHDYLLGMEVPTQTDKKDTAMRFVMPVPGVRVFRLDALSPEQLSQVKTVTNLGEISADQPSGANAPQAHMPYKGFIYASSPVEVDGYKIEVIVLHRGEADLVIRKGEDTVRRRIYADKAYQFGTMEDAIRYEMMVGGNTLTIYSKAISDILPVGVDIEIRETKGVARKESACSFQQSGGMLTLQNGMIRIEVNAGLGGRVSTFITEKDGINHVASDQGPKTGIIESINMNIPGVFAGMPFNCEVVTNTAGEIVIQLKSREQAGEKRATKRFTLKSGEAAFSESVEVALEGTTEEKMRLRMQSILGVGGAADYCDNLYLPVEGAVTNISCSTGSDTGFLTPAKDWAGIVDHKQKMALVEQFSPEEIKNVYMCMGNDFYTMELFKREGVIKPGQTEKINVRFLMIPGMSALDTVTNDLALALDVSAASLKTEQDMPVSVELGSALESERPVHLKLVLMKDGIQNLEIGKWEGVASYDKPVKQSFTLARKALAETGQYTVKLVASDAKGGIIGTVEKIFPAK